MSRTGADVIVEALIKENVEYVFGYPGGAILDVFDKMYASKDNFNFVLVRHEQAAAHMADGYARVTGKPGVVIVTSGPGATNTITGLATAYLDSIPMVMITGQVPSHFIGNDAFQEADVTGITRPVTKHNYLVQDINDLPRIIKEAFFVATSGRPGPVLIDIPKDIQNHICSVPYPDSVDLPSYKPNYEGNMNQIRRMAQKIKESKKPVAYVGGGAILSDASKELYDFIKKTGIPITTTLMALGAFPEDEPESLMMLGMHGTRYANYAIQECDLLLAIGSRFDDRVTGKLDEFAPLAEVIHVDIDPTSISKNKFCDLPVVGDIKDVLAKLTPIVEAPEIAEWVAKCQKWKTDYPLTYKLREDIIIPQEVIATVNEFSKGEAIIATDVGQHQMWAAQFITFKKARSWCTSGGLGTMGYGLPAALGAQCGAKDKVVFNICGDGGFQMLAEELATASLYNLPVISIIINNQCLGMVRQWQELFYEKHYAMTQLDKNSDLLPTYDPNYVKLRENAEKPNYVPDFVKLADAYDCYGQRIVKREDIRPAILAAIERAKIDKKPSVLEFMVASDENVFPMVPAGSRIDEMLDSLI